MDAAWSPGQDPKPGSTELRELQRQFLQIRWQAICDRGDQAFYSRTIETAIVANAPGYVGTASAGARAAKTRHNLPSNAAAATPLLSSAFLFLDAVSCCLLTRRRKFSDFGGETCACIVVARFGWLAHAPPRPTLGRWHGLVQ